MTTLLRPPEFVEVKTATRPEDSWLAPWTRMAWSEFVEANPDIAPEVAADLAVYGLSTIGGGAAPTVRIRKASATRTLICGCTTAGDACPVHAPRSAP